MDQPTRHKLAVALRDMIQDQLARPEAYRPQLGTPAPREDEPEPADEPERQGEGER